MMKCPVCGKTVSHLFKCDRCGDVRCNHSAGCNSPKGPFGKSGQGAVRGKICRVCRKGRYQPI